MGQEHFLQNPSQFIIQCHPPIWCYTTYAAENVPLNKIRERETKENKPSKQINKHTCFNK